MQHLLQSLVIVGLLFVACAVSAFGNDGDADILPDEGPWRLILKGQLSAEKGCELNAVLMFHQIPLGEDIAIDGRVSCLDGREFNVSRQRGHQKFVIELCEPAVC